MLETEQQRVVQGLKAGDEDVFSQVVLEWTPAMRRVAARYLRSDSSIEDVLQETWIAVVRGLPGFRGESALRTWVMGILINIARKQGVKDAKTIPLSSLAPADQTPAEHQERFLTANDRWANHWSTSGEPFPWSPERLLLSKEIQSTLLTALDELPERQRTVVALRDVDGLSSDEVCQALDLSSANQRVLLHRGRVQLRAALEKFMTDGENDE
jgi:RNA polymerase sigma-70 factor, ECF subfamily